METLVKDTDTTLFELARRHARIIDDVVAFLPYHIVNYTIIAVIRVDKTDNEAEPIYTQHNYALLRARDDDKYLRDFGRKLAREHPSMPDSVTVCYSKPSTHSTRHSPLDCYAFTTSPQETGLSTKFVVARDNENDYDKLRYRIISQETNIHPTKRNTVLRPALSIIDSIKEELKSTQIKGGG